MAKAFAVPYWRKALMNRTNKRKAIVISKAVSHIDKILEDATEKIINTAIFSGGTYFQPSLNGLDVAAEQFYLGVIHQAFYSCEDEKSSQQNRKRLAKAPKGIPRKLSDLDQILKDKTYFRQIMRRSGMLSKRLKRQYLSKLRKRFDKVMPLLQSGEITSSDAKKQMRDVWHATKPRVETIFRTETTNYFGKIQVNFFKDDKNIIGFLFDSNVDSARTEICRSRHGMIFTKEYKGKNSITYNTPALHYNCRSDLIALANTAENRKLLEDASRDPRHHNLEPLPDGWR